MNVAVIPARGGSKRIPRKNIKPFLGKPMIGWSIEAAIASGCFDEVVVSTDDPQIAEIARSFGASVPFVRPADLANDTAATLPVIAHAVNWFLQEERRPDGVCCIYPTAPLLEVGVIQKGYELLVATDADYVITCCRFEFPVQRSVAIGQQGYLSAEFPESINSRSQDLKPLYHDAGQLYWGRAEAFVSMRPMFTGKALPLLIPHTHVQDIDDEDDWQRVEFLAQWMSGKSREES